MKNIQFYFGSIIICVLIIFFSLISLIVIMLRTQYENIADTLFFNKRFPDISLQNTATDNHAGMCQLLGFRTPISNGSPHKSKTCISSNGLYFFSTGYIYGNTVSVGTKPKDMKLMLIRSDKEGNIQWDLLLDTHYGSMDYQKVFLEENMVNDDDENLYLSGHVSSRKFFGYSVPEEHSLFIISISKQGSVNWVSFLPKDHSNFSTALTVADNTVKSAFVSNDGALLHNISLDIATGKILSDHSVDLTSLGDLTKVSIQAINHGWIMVAKQFETYFQISLIIHRYSFDGQTEWRYSQDIDMESPSFWYHQPEHVREMKEPFLLSFVITSNQTHTFVCNVFAKVNDQTDSADSAIKQVYKNLVLALDQNGKLDWQYETYLEDDFRIMNAVCNDTTLFLTGLTSTNTMKTTGQAFQQTLHGQTDLFLLSLDGKGNPIWSTYLGGKGIEAYPRDFQYHSNEDNIPFFTFLTDQNLVVTFSSSSLDFPLIPETVNKHIVQDVQGSCYGVVATLDLQGNLIKSEPMIQSIPSDQQNSVSEAKTDPPLKEIICDSIVFDKQLYSLVTTNRTDFTLINSKLDHLRVPKEDYENHDIEFILLTRIELKEE